MHELILALKRPGASIHWLIVDQLAQAVTSEKILPSEGYTLISEFACIRRHGGTLFTCTHVLWRKG